MASASLLAPVTSPNAQFHQLRISYPKKNAKINVTHSILFCSMKFSRSSYFLRLNKSSRQRGVDVSCSIASEESDTVSSPSETSLISTLKDAISQKDSEKTKNALDQLKQDGKIKLWNSYPNVTRRTTFLNELKQIGIKNAETLAIPSVRNDALFLGSVVLTTSVLAVLTSQLPGDFGFFVPYLIGSLSLVVLAVGSVAPGLFEAGIGAFSSFFPDYKERILSHEAAHFLSAYFLGIPIVSYSLDIGKEHVNLLDVKLQKKLYENKLTTNELDKLAVVSMAGLAAEGLNYEKVVGQSADLFSLQRLINRSNQRLSNNDQQNLTRWAVYYACSLIKTNSKTFESLKEAMAKGGSVEDCILAIEGISL